MLGNLWRETLCDKLQFQGWCPSSWKFLAWLIVSSSVTAISFSSWLSSSPELPPSQISASIRVTVPHQKNLWLWGVKVVKIKNAPESRRSFPERRCCELSQTYHEKILHEKANIAGIILDHNITSWRFIFCGCSRTKPLHATRQLHLCCSTQSASIIWCHRYVRIHDILILLIGVTGDLHWTAKADDPQEDVDIVFRESVQMIAPDPECQAIPIQNRTWCPLGNTTICSCLVSGLHFW